MEIVTGIIAWITANWANLGLGIFSVLGGFSIIAKLTPTKADDAIVDTLLNIVHTLGLTKASGK